jgi:hypothetical protein
MTARVAVPAPRKSIADAVNAIALQPYSLGDWKSRARAVAAELRFGDERDVAATMVHPSAPPEAQDAFEWVFRRQIAAALVLANLDDGWANSRRRTALTSLLHGPIDWTTTAALVALTAIAQDEPAHAADIVAMLRSEIDGPVTPIHWTCIHEPLLDLLDRLPIDEALRRRLAQMRAESESA